jgi:hypothetical protein
MKSLTINQLFHIELQNASLYFDKCLDEIIDIQIFFEDKFDTSPFKDNSNFLNSSKYHHNCLDFELFEVNDILTKNLKYN